MSSPGFLPVRDPTSPSMKKQLTKVSESQSVSKTGTSKPKRKQSRQADSPCEEERAMPRDYAALPGSPAHCGNDFCRLGCICDSLMWKAEESMQHCRKLECMFECKCERFPSLRILRARKRPAIFREDGMVFYDEAGLLSDLEDKKKRRLDPRLPATKTEPSKEKTSSKAAIKPASNSSAQKVVECKKEIPPKDSSSKLLSRPLKKDPGFSRGRVYVAKHIKYAAKVEEQRQEELKKQQKGKAESSVSGGGTSGSVPPLKVIKTADGFSVKACDEELEDRFKLLRKVDRMLLLGQQYRKRRAEESEKKLVHDEKVVNPTSTHTVKDAETREMPAEDDIDNEELAKNADNHQNKQIALEAKGKEPVKKSGKEVLHSDSKNKQVEHGGIVRHTAKSSKDDVTDHRDQNALKTPHSSMTVTSGTKRPKPSGQQAVWIATGPVNEHSAQSPGVLAKPLSEQVVYSQINNSGQQSIRIAPGPLTVVSSQSSVSFVKPIAPQLVHSQGNVVVSSMPAGQTLIPISSPTPHTFIPLSQVPVRSVQPSQTVLQPNLIQVQPTYKPAQVRTVSNMLTQKRQLHNQGRVTKSLLQPTPIIRPQPPAAVKGQPVILVPSASQTAGAKTKNIQAFLVHNPDGKTVLLVPAQKHGKPALAPARLPAAVSKTEQKIPSTVKVPMHPYLNSKVVPRLCDIAGHATSVSHMFRKELVHVAKRKRSIFLPNIHKSNPNRAFHLLVDVFSNCSWEQNGSILNQPIFNLAATVGNVPNLKISKYTIQRLNFRKHSQVAKSINVSSSVAGNCRKKIRIIGLFESKFFITDGTDPLLRATANGSYVFDYQQAITTPSRQTHANTDHRDNHTLQVVANKSTEKHPAVQTLSQHDITEKTCKENKNITALHSSICEDPSQEKKSTMEETTVINPLPERTDGGCSANQAPLGLQSAQSDAAKNETRADCIQDGAFQSDEAVSLSCDESLDDDEMQAVSDTEKGQSCKGGEHDTREDCTDSQDKCTLAEDVKSDFVKEVQPQRMSAELTDNQKVSGEGEAKSYTSPDCYGTTNQSSEESSTCEKRIPDQIYNESRKAVFSSQGYHERVEGERDTPVEKGKEGTNLKTDETSSSEETSKLIIDVTETSLGDNVAAGNMLEMSEGSEKETKNENGGEENSKTDSKEKDGNLRDFAGNEGNVAPLRGEFNEPIPASNFPVTTATLAGHKLVTLKEGNENLQTNKPESLTEGNENRKLIDTKDGEKSPEDGDVSQRGTAPEPVSVPKGNKNAEQEEENDDGNGTPRKEDDKQLATVDDVSSKHTDSGGSKAEGNGELENSADQFEKQDETESLHPSDQDVSRSLHSLVENLSNRVTDVLIPEDVVVPEDKDEQQDTEEDDVSDNSSSSDEDEDNSFSESENEVEDAEVTPARSQWFLGATSCTLRLAALVEKAFEGENLFTACWPEGYLEVSEAAQPGKTGFESSFLTGHLSGMDIDWPLRPRKKEVKFMPPHSLTDLLQKRQAQREAERERAKKLAREEKKNSFKDLPPSKRLPIRDKVKSLEYCVVEKTVVISDDDIDILAVEEDDELSSDEESIYTTSSYEDEQRSKNEALFRLAELLPDGEVDVKSKVEDDLSTETSSGQNIKPESSEVEGKGLKDCGNDQILPQDCYSGISDSDSENSDELDKLSDKAGITPKVELSNDDSGASTPSSKQRSRLSETDQRVADLEKELYRSLHGKSALTCGDQSGPSDDLNDGVGRRGVSYCLRCFL